MTFFLLEMQCQELSPRRTTTKVFREKKCEWSEVENVLVDGVNTHRAGDRRVSTVQIRLEAKTVTTKLKLNLIEDFGSGPSWCLRLMGEIN